MMQRLDAVKEAISELTLEERAELNKWFYNWVDDDWDKQMKEDVASGKLDKLLAEVDKDIAEGRLYELP